MVNKLLAVLILSILLPTALSESINSCLDSNTLNMTTSKVITVDTNSTVIETWESKHCPGGCASGECKPIKSSMPIEIYIFLCAVAIGTMFVSMFKPDVLIMKWVAVILFVMLGASSFNLNRIYCEHTSSGWDCFVHQYTATNLAYLWFGLGAIMLIYAIISSIYQPAKEITGQV